ncbi:MAG: hypothetical protein J6S85_14750 [Methanobrevibacter sp.]|nr:hypothetical protein [Methanobrevibacter sp.]
MEIDRELVEIRNSLNEISNDLYNLRSATDGDLANYEKELDERYAQYDLPSRKTYGPRMFGSSWEWSPNKQERAEQKRNRIISFFTNYNDNLEDVRIYWISSSEIITYVNLEPNYVYFKSYEGILGKHHRNMNIEVPTLITNVYVKPQDIVVRGDLVYSCIYLNLPYKLNEIIKATKLRALEYDKFKKLVSFYEWCKSTCRYATIAAKTICENPVMLNETIQFEDLYKEIIERYKTYHPNCMLTSKSKIQPEYGGYTYYKGPADRFEEKYGKELENTKRLVDESIELFVKQLE